MMLRTTAYFLVAACTLAHPLTSSLAADATDDVARAALEKGLEHQRKGEYDQAITALNNASELGGDPATAAEILVELAETHFRKGKSASEGRLEDTDPDPILRQAAKLFDEVLKKYANVTEQASIAAYMKGSSYLLLGDTQRAFDAYRFAYTKYRDSDFGPKALLRLGVCLASLGDAKKAVQIFKLYIKNNKDHEKHGKAIPKLRKYIYELGMVGRPAPKLRAKWQNGRVQNGLKDLHDEVVVLVYFASWCKVCSRELPRLQREIKHWSDKGVVFIGIANPDDPQATEPPDFYVRRNEIDFFDVGLDSGGASWRPYRVTGLPAAVVIDRRGIVRWRGHFSFMGRSLLESLIKEPGR